MIGDTVFLIAELIALFFVVATAIHLFQRRLGNERLRAWMGGSPLQSALKGIAVGFVTPFCTYSAIPMLVGLRQAGVPPAGYVAFISAAPVLDPVLFGALVVIVGLKAALIYTAVAFTAAIGLALAAKPLGIERHLKPIDVPANSAVVEPVGVHGSSVAPETIDEVTQPVDSCGSGGDQQPWRGLGVEFGPAVRSAVDLLRSMAPLLLAGVAVGLLIEVFVSPDMVAAVTGNNGPWSIPVAAALGTPLYFSTSLFVPIANSLTNAGVGIGAIVALTIAGAGANVPELIILTKLASTRVIALFFGYVFSVAFAGGLIAQTLLG